EKKYSKNNENSFINPLKQRAFLDVLGLQRLQQRHWSSKHDGNPPKSESDWEEVSKVKLEDMGNIQLDENSSWSVKDGFFTPDFNKPVFDPGKSKSRPINMKERISSMLKILTLLKAQGKTSFKCTSNDPKDIKAFRLAAEAMKIPHNKLEIIQTKTTRLGKKAGTTAKKISPGKRFSIKELYQLDDARKEFQDIQKKSHKKYTREFAKQQQQKIEQMSQQSQSNDVDQSAPRTPTI
ncbi:MAG: hypothetical protein HRT87_11280, partial [Legionellales bacterium]|nr:hypothetical protein [Legionellales bacterium]